MVANMVRSEMMMTVGSPLSLRVLVLSCNLHFASQFLERLHGVLFHDYYDDNNANGDNIIRIIRKEMTMTRHLSSC